MAPTEATVAPARVHARSESAPTCPWVVRNWKAVQNGTPRKYLEVFFTLFYFLWMNPIKEVGDPSGSNSKSAKVNPNTREEQEYSTNVTRKLSTDLGRSWAAWR